MEPITPEQALRLEEERKAKKRECDRLYREKNKEKIAEQRRQRAEIHAEEMKAKAREYQRKYRSMPGGVVEEVVLTPDEALRQYEERKVKQKEAQARYRETHKEYLVEYRKKYYEEHADELRKRNVEYMRKHRAALKA